MNDTGPDIRVRRFRNEVSDYSTAFVLDESHILRLEDPVIPPIGTRVRLPGGVDAEVEKVVIDLSSKYDEAMILVSCKRVDPSAHDAATREKDAHHVLV